MRSSIQIQLVVSIRTSFVKGPSGHCQLMDSSRSWVTHWAFWPQGCLNWGCRRPCQLTLIWSRCRLNSDASRNYHYAEFFLFWTLQRFERCCFFHSSGLLCIGLSDCLVLATRCLGDFCCLRSATRSNPFSCHLSSTKLADLNLAIASLTFNTRKTESHLVPWYCLGLIRNGSLLMVHLPAILVLVFQGYLEDYSQVPLLPCSCHPLCSSVLLGWTYCGLTCGSLIYDPMSPDRYPPTLWRMRVACCTRRPSILIRYFPFQ